ncbi:hypothetical protein QJS66_01560 [Kocuria rhizophila]|nr:hypothetical protein QJS66_01560 [Kocuria rhizophila]
MGHLLPDPADRHGMGVDEELHAEDVPHGPAPQGHDIIRTWLFSTVVRAETLAGSVPWTNTRCPGGSWTRTAKDVQVQGQTWWSPDGRAREVRRGRRA